MHREDKLEYTKLACIILTIGGTILAISNPVIGLTISCSATFLSLTLPNY